MPAKTLSCQWHHALSKKLFYSRIIFVFDKNYLFLVNEILELFGIIPSNNFERIIPKNSPNSQEKRARQDAILDCIVQTKSSAVSVTNSIMNCGLIVVLKI